jgi:hypothetical protein
MEADCLSSLVAVPGELVYGVCKNGGYLSKQLPHNCGDEGTVMLGRHLFLADSARTAIH